MSARKPDSDDTLLFKDQEEWERWLSMKHSSSEGIWMRIAKKGAEEGSASYAEAHEVALCFGWIDGQKKSFDETHWLQRFTPRRAKSIWSKINREAAERLISEGKMHPPGLAEVEKAKADGRWESAYDSHSTSSIPADFLEALERHPKAKAFFESLNKANLYAISFRLQTAKKPETRQKRFDQILEMMKRGEKFH